MTKQDTTFKKYVRFVARIIVGALLIINVYQLVELYKITTKLDQSNTQLEQLQNKVAAAPKK